jgi:hypothetical protein
VRRDQTKIACRVRRDSTLLMLLILCSRLWNIDLLFVVTMLDVYHLFASLFQDLAAPNSNSFVDSLDSRVSHAQFGMDLRPLTQRKVATPTTTTIQLIFATRSLPFAPPPPPPRRPPIIPEFRRFHQVLGIIQMTLTNESMPRDASPFKKCSSQLASSSGLNIGSSFVLIDDNGSEEISE